MLLILIAAAIALFVYLKSRGPTHDLFEKQGIAFKKPGGFINTLIYFLFKRRAFTDTLDEWYNEFKNEKYAGKKVTKIQSHSWNNFQSFRHFWVPSPNRIYPRSENCEAISRERFRVLYRSSCDHHGGNRSDVWEILGLVEGAKMEGHAIDLESCFHW